MTTPRLLFAALLAQEPGDALEAFIDREGLARRLGSALFRRANWHQSLSNQFWPGDERDLEDRLLRAGSRLSATAVPLLFNRVTCQRAHAAFRAKGTPVGFPALLEAVRAALATEGLVSPTGHTPHTTFSYSAPEGLPSLKIDPPIRWLIDKVWLVKGCGDGSAYHYERLGEWNLHPLPQRELF